MTKKPNKTSKAREPKPYHPTPQERAFLAAIAVRPNISHASRASGWSREMHHRKYKENPGYRKLFDEAKEMGIEALEDIAENRAAVGTQDVVMYQGQPCYWKYRRIVDKKSKEVTVVPVGPPITRTVHSDGLLQFLLRGAKPHKYREQIAVKHTGQLDTSPKKFTGTMEELLALYRKMTSKSAAA